MTRYLVAAAAAAVGILAATPYVEAQQQRSFYDARGSFAGSSVERGNTTSVYDRSGRFDGTIVRTGPGSRSFYDGRGRFTGSSTGERR